MAVGDQVLLSRSAGDAVRPQLGIRGALVDRGAPRPRDLGRPEHVLELVAAGHSPHPSALRSLDDVPTNLPLQLTSFVGRPTELRSLAGLIADTHLVTLTGPGGCGKTRLGLQLAASVVDRYPGGVWLADIAPLADPTLVAAQVAEAVGVPLNPQQAVEQTLAERLASSVSLLVLDNCEHLTDACAALVELLVRACPRLTVVATSREPLGVDGEAAWRVPSLSLPAAGQDRSHEPPSEAVRLFVERSQATRATFRLDERNCEAVAEICRRLDGIPLAIELAAARSGAMSPGLILEQLGNCFSLLTGGRAGGLPRHRTLEASLEWSYSLLDEEQRSLFSALAVFVGGFDLDAAAAVGAGLPLSQWTVLDGLSALVDKSLIVVDDEQETSRFTMRETMRQFATTKMIAAGDAESVRERHAGHFDAMARRLAPVLEGRGMAGALAELDRDVDNLRSALDWRIQQGRTEDALRMSTALWLFWLRDRSAEGARRLRDALAIPGGEPVSRALALVSLGCLLINAGNLAAVIELGEEALRVAGKSGDERAVGRAKSLIAYGGVFAAATDPTEQLREALRLHRIVGDDYFHILTLSGLVMAGWMTGDSRLMRDSVAEMFSVADACGNPQMRIRASSYAAFAAYAFGALDEAMAHCAVATDITAEVHDELFASIVVAIRARVFGVRGHHDEAAEAAGDATARSRAINNLLGVALALWAESLSLKDQGAGHAGAALERGRTLFELLAFAPIFAELSLAAAQLAVNQGDARGAASLADSLGQWAGTARAAGCRPFAALAEAEVALLNEDLERARTAANVALTVSVGFGNEILATAALEFVAHLAALTRRHLEAARLYGAASAVRRRLGTPVPPADRLRREIDLKDLQEAMGEDALAAAIAEGDAITLDAAVGYAKRGRGSRRRPAAGWSSLTPTEMEVVNRVAEGLTNAEVASRLFMTVATVKSHLVRVFRKLDVTNRAELTAAAHNRR